VAAAAIALAPPALAAANATGNGNGNGSAAAQPAPASSTAPGHNRTSGTSDPNPRPTSTGPGQSDHRDGNASTTGSTASAQPTSNADSNNTGANSTSSTNPYRSTRHGAASGNGNGSGHAYGKPCAGCVGKADNKNPHGQQPGGNDGNAGYECDSNRGIGQTNPAHTGCVTSTSTPTCTTPPCQPSTPLTHALTPPVTGSVVAGATVAANVLGVPQVLGERVTAFPPARAPATPVRPTKAARLPFTGSDTALLVSTSLALLAGGFTALTLGRTRRGIVPAAVVTWRDA
jgi:hypothetical protein